MMASEAKRISKQAIDDGYDHVIDSYLKKIKRAAHVGLMETKEAIIPWMKVETKHINWFIDRGYEVEVEDKDIIFRWGE